MAQIGRGRDRTPVKSAARLILLVAVLSGLAGCIPLISNYVLPVVDPQPAAPVSTDPDPPTPYTQPAAAADTTPTVTAPVSGAGIESPQPDQAEGEEEEPPYETSEAPEETGETRETEEPAQEDILDESAPEVGEKAAEVPVQETNPPYIPDLTYRQIEELWTSNPASLGSISVGIPACGRLENGVQMPEGPYWRRANPKNQWGTAETIDSIVRAITFVNTRFSDTPPLIVGNLSARRGGYLRPHHSHQAGRDVDFSLYPAEGQPIRFFRGDARTLDIPRNWALVRALITETDVQYILIDRQIQRLLKTYALSIGEDPAWLEQVFVTGTPDRRPIIQHVRRHRDHYHVRFFSPRAQQLGTLLHASIKARADGEKEKRDLYYRVRKGDTLGHLARRYRTTVRAIQRSNRMRSTRLRIGQTLVIPGRGGGNLCPPPTPLVIPSRLLPPADLVSRTD